MANQEIKGVNVGLYVDVSGTQTLVAAKRNLEFEETSESIDVGHADTFGWIQRISGQQGATLDWDGVMLLDDGTGSFAASHAALRDAKRGGNTITAQVRYPFGNNADEFPCIVESITLTAPYDAEATIAVSLASAGQITEVTT